VLFRSVKRVMGSIDCKNPGNIPAKVAKALAQIHNGPRGAARRSPVPSDHRHCR